MQIHTLKIAYYIHKIYIYVCVCVKFHLTFLKVKLSLLKNLFDIYNHLDRFKIPLIYVIA